MAVAQWLEGVVQKVIRKVGSSIPTFATQRSVKLTAGGVSVLAMADVPLSKALYPLVLQCMAFLSL